MRPSRDDMLMEMAVAASMRSTCSRASVGAVLSHDARPVSLGYNGAPKGMNHCDHSCDCECRGDKVPKDVEVHQASCRVYQHCTLAVHAESNCIAFAARHGVATDGGQIHVTLSPCLPCSMLIINAGVRRLVYLKEYRITDGLELMENAGIDIEQFVR